MKPPSRADLTWLLCGWLVCAAILVAHAWPTLDTAVDDAWISARFAANLVEGHGLVYSAGGPAVEGFTNLLWTLWLALGLGLGFEAHPLMTQSGLLHAVLLLPASTGLAAVVAGRWHPATLLAPLALALSPHLAAASTNGLETAQWLLLVVLGSGLALGASGRLRIATAVVCALLPLCRPEGIAVAGALLGADLVRHRSAPRRPGTWGPVAAFALTLGVVEAWRLATYGAWLPNTFAAKGARPFGDQLADNLTYVRRDGGLWPGVGLALLGAALAPPVRLERAVLAIVSVGLVIVAFQVNLWMPGARLLLPAAVLAACALAGLASSSSTAGRLAAGLLVSSMAALHLSSISAAVRRYDSHHTALPGNGAQRAATHVSERLPAGSVVAVRDAGLFAYAIGPRHRVVETHPRALTLPHPAGADAAVLDYAPVRPALIVGTVARAEQPRPKYPNDLRLLDRAGPDYVYLGRVEQHYHRFYDLWVRADLEMPALPEEIVVNRRGRR